MIALLDHKFLFISELPNDDEQRMFSFDIDSRPEVAIRKEP